MSAVDPLTHATFAPHAGTTFRVLVEPAPLVLQLAEVSELRGGPRVETFSLEFRGPLDALLPQGEYQFEHDVIGTFALFIVPVGRDESASEYEAVFNRVLPRS